MEEKEDSWLTRARGDVHPEQMAEFVPVHLFKPKYDDNPVSYDSLTDVSSYSDYAWAFLRRNRFYQNKFDQNKKFRMFQDIRLWGYTPPSEYAEPYWGLMSDKEGNTKPYWENHGAGDKVLWEAIHGFYYFFSDRNGIERNIIEKYKIPRVIPCETAPGMSFGVTERNQRAFVFDADAMLGPGSTTIDIQLSIARAILLNDIKQLGNSDRKSSSGERSGNGLAKQRTASSQARQATAPPTKSDLRTQLRVADLLSWQYVCEPTPGQGNTTNPVWETGKSRPRHKQIAGKLAESSVGRTFEEKRISDLVDAAYRKIYEWECLQLLQYDDWAEYFFPTPEDT